MTTNTGTAASVSVGALLRQWRMHRRVSQLELSNEAAISTRHLSFVETGRSQPSREMVLRIAEHLEVPFRDRNQLLMAAGFAPRYSENDLDSPGMASCRARRKLGFWVEILGFWDFEPVLTGLVGTAENYLKVQDSAF